MAIRNIKEVIDNKGYVITTDDRKIFQELEDLQSFFGFSATDAIEFIIYDINDNQLPQLDGKLVRYIPLTTENINDYFLIPEGTIFQKYQLPKEYFIDIERLLGEGGYSNGIFKTQITLINKRVGTETRNDKLWIQEISPSRTEVRLLPLKEGIIENPELKERFNAFVNDSEFREDTIAYLFEFIEKIKPTEISTFLKSKYTSEWLENLVNEFKIENFEIFINIIYDKFIQSSIYEFTNRISKIGDINYGNSKQTKPSIILSKETVIEICKRIFVETINYYLAQQDVKTKTEKVIDFIPSEDPVSDILQRNQSDIVVPPKKVELLVTKIEKSPVEEKRITLEKAIIKEVAEELPVITEVLEPDYVRLPPPNRTISPPIDANIRSNQTNEDRIVESLLLSDRRIGFGDSRQISVREENDGSEPQE